MLAFPYDQGALKFAPQFAPQIQFAPQFAPQK
jgi:hypothetical protein